MCCHSKTLRQTSLLCEISCRVAKVASEVKRTPVLPGTYVYGEPLCVFQVAEYLVGRQGNAFIHGVTTCAPVKSNTFRHGRRRFDAVCAADARAPRPANREPRTARASSCKQVNETIMGGLISSAIRHSWHVLAHFPTENERRVFHAVKTTKDALRSCLGASDFL